MTVRPARFADALAIERLIRNQHIQSKYADRVTINVKALDQLVLGLIAGMTQQGPGATHVTVLEEEGEVVGFVAGVLNRVYNIGNRLVSNDLFLVNEGKAGGIFKLIDAYIAWASANPKVIEIGLSWTDAIPGADRLSKIYQRKGFDQIGEHFALQLDKAQELAA